LHWMESGFVPLGLLQLFERLIVTLNWISTYCIDTAQGLAEN